MSIFDSISGRDTAAEAGRTVGVEAGLALGAYDKNAKAAIEGQNSSQQQAKTEGLVKDKVIPDLQIGDSKAMSGGAPSPEKIGEAIGDAVNPSKSLDGQSKSAHLASTTGDAPPASGSLPLPEKTAGTPVKTF